MNSEVLIFLSVLLLIVALIFLALLMFLYRLMNSQREDHKERERIWEKERESLLNRSMTKEWESYAQIQALNGVVSSDSNERYVGMSDAEEVARLQADSQGTGETLVDLSSDMRELGLT